jgi:hypothetical protein
MNFDAYVYEPQPPPSTINRWRAEVRTDNSHRTMTAPTKEQAMEALRADLGAGVNITWHDELPQWSRVKPPGFSAAPADAPAIEHEGVATKFHRLALRAFHQDLHGSKKRWSADQIVAALNEAWERANAKTN